MIKVTIKSPLDIRKDKLKVLLCPDWQKSNKNGSSKIKGEGCDGLYDFVNDVWISQSDVSKQAVWVKDSKFGEKWFLKFDGVNDEYFHESFQPIKVKDNAQILVVHQFPSKYGYECLFSTPGSYLFTSGASIRSNGLYSGQYNLNWYSGYVTTFVRRADPRYKPGWSYQATNSVYQINHLGWGDANTSYGFVVGSNIGGRFFSGSFALLAIWEDSDPISKSEISQLMEFGKYYFNGYRNYTS